AALVEAAERAVDAFTVDGCCYSFRDWHDDVNAAAVPFREPREGRWLILSCSGPASSMGEEVFRNRIGPKLKALARRLGELG
ncbi:IclR family transcriptional regulator, partial [Burkholderia thailandensis]|nr:IclR family transcriptional regulator [Burkholderia thailandensis]